ncbi:MAG: membrane protein insertion efficiency factor YidD [Thermodesulfobacteriota bacterium]
MYLRRGLLAAIRVYQWAISPLLGPRCRFEPSCSHYCIEAVEKYGLLNGSYLFMRRLVRCQPFSAGGYDPVP